MPDSCPNSTLYIDGDAKEATLIKTDQATGAVTTHGVVLTAKDTKAQRRLTSFNSASDDERCHENGACLFTYAELMHIHGRDQHGRILVPSQDGPGGPGGPMSKEGAKQSTTTDGEVAGVIRGLRRDVDRKGGMEREGERGSAAPSAPHHLTPTPLHKLPPMQAPNPPPKPTRPPLLLRMPKCSRMARRPCLGNPPSTKRTNSLPRLWLQATTRPLARIAGILSSLPTKTYALHTGSAIASSPHHPTGEWPMWWVATNLSSQGLI